MASTFPVNRAIQPSLERLRSAIALRNSSPVLSRHATVTPSTAARGALPAIEQFAGHRVSLVAPPPRSKPCLAGVAVGSREVADRAAVPTTVSMAATASNALSCQCYDDEESFLPNIGRLRGEISSAVRPAQSRDGASRSMRC
jgi:hypothetical protein